MFSHQIHKGYIESCIFIKNKTKHLYTIKKGSDITRLKSVICMSPSYQFVVGSEGIYIREFLGTWHKIDHITEDILPI